MSADEESALPERLRTVTPEYFGRSDREMDAIGWLVFLGILVLLIPLLPYLALIWLIGKLTDRITGKPRAGT